MHPPLNPTFARVYRPDEAMTMRSFLLPLIGLLLPFALQAQTGDKAAEMPAPAREPYQGAWKAEEQQTASDLWRAISEREPDNAQARYNQFVSARNASMARNDGELPEADRKELVSIASSLEQAAPNSFEAHMVQFHLLFPQRSAFSELSAATAIDADRAELLGPKVAKAMIDGDEGASDPRLQGPGKPAARSLPP